MKGILGIVFAISTLLALHSHASESIAPSLDKQARQKPTDFGAEVLWSKSSTVIAEDGHWRRVEYISVRLNDLSAARDYGRISIPFDHYYTDTQLDFANVRSASGVISAVAEDAVQLRVTGGGQDFYSDSSEYVFSLPNIAPGSIIEFQFTKKSKVRAIPELFSDHVTPFWFQPTVGGDGWRVDFVQQHVYELTHPQTREFHRVSYRGYPDKPSISRAEGTVTARWEMKKVAPISSEAWMPKLSEVAPQLFISSHDDWAVVDAWAWSNAVDKFAATDRLRETVTSFQLPKNATVLEKTRAVYDYLQSNIRYVFAHLGRGGYEPHFADEVIKANYGDCKDQAVLGVALLRLLGVEATIALVETPQAGDHDTQLVSLIFDHMIIHVPATETTPALWLDTTGDRALYPGVSNYLYYQPALIVDGKGGQLTRITEGFSDNRAELVLNYHQNKRREIVVNATVHLSGFFEENVRSWWIHNKERESELDKFLKSIFANATEYQYTGKLHNADSLTSPVELTAQFVFPADSDPEEPALYGMSISQILNLFGDLKHLQTPDSRNHRFVDKYAYELLVQANLKANSGEIPTLIRSSGNVITPHVSLEQQGQRTDSGYQVTMALKRPALDISVDEYKKYHRTLEKINQRDPWLISMQSDTLLEQQNQLADVLETSGADSLEYSVALSRSNIEAGKFEEALKNARKAIEIDENNGEAWYLLGMAQGFTDAIEESMESFDRAESLGYLP